MFYYIYEIDARPRRDKIPVPLHSCTTSSNVRPSIHLERGSSTFPPNTHNENAVRLSSSLYLLPVLSSSLVSSSSSSHYFSFIFLNLFPVLSSSFVCSSDSFASFSLETFPDKDEFLFGDSVIRLHCFDTFCYQTKFQTLETKIFHIFLNVKLLTLGMHPAVVIRSLVTGHVPISRQCMQNGHNTLHIWPSGVKQTLWRTHLFGG